MDKYLILIYISILFFTNITFFYHYLIILLLQSLRLFSLSLRAIWKIAWQSHRETVEAHRISEEIATQI